MVSREQALEMAQEWVEAFNSHDLDRIMSHYDEDVELTSPTAVRLLGDPSGTVRGKAALRAYFEKGLAAYPDLHFELRELFVGVDSVAVCFGNDRGVLVNEVMTLRVDGKVTRVLVLHAIGPE